MPLHTSIPQLCLLLVTSETSMRRFGTSIFLALYAGAHLSAIESYPHAYPNPRQPYNHRQSAVCPCGRPRLVPAARCAGDDFGLNIILPQCLVLFKLYLIVHCEQW